MGHDERVGVKKIECSVPILTLNSAAHLEQCLESVRDFADVFLLDGNSTDATHSIARRYAVPVYRQIDTNESNIEISNFTDMRVRGEHLARFDWILYLDSDEFISNKLADEICEALSSGNSKRIFTAPKIAIMGTRVVRHSFNAPDYAPHLYNRKSGVFWKPGKLVHEKLVIPKDVRVVKLSGELYSHFISSYGEALKKDDFYLSLTRRRMFAPGQPRAIKASVSSLWINFMRAGNIFYKSLNVYLRYGFRESLPPLHAWRYVRYHLAICAYCILKLWVGLHGAKK